MVNCFIKPSYWSIVFREHFKNLFSIGYEEGRGRVYTVGQDRNVAVTRLETGTKVRIVIVKMIT